MLTAIEGDIFQHCEESKGRELTAEGCAEASDQQCW